jgi:hypothetical protein
LELAASTGKPCVVFAGRVRTQGGGADFVSLEGLEPDPARSLARAASLLESATAAWALAHPSPPQ